MSSWLSRLGNHFTYLLIREILEIYLVKAAGDTLGVLLCIYLKRMYEVQRLISTGLRNIHNMTKHKRVIGLRAICTMASFYYFGKNPFCFPFIFQFGSPREV